MKLLICSFFKTVFNLKSCINELSESAEPGGCFSIKDSKTSIISNFQPFMIEFNNYKIKCIKHMRHDSDYSFNVYRGIDINLNQIFDVYEYKISLEKNGIFEKKKLESCQAEVIVFHA
jgi:hypothetical protein